MFEITDKETKSTLRIYCYFQVRFHFLGNRFGNRREKRKKEQKSKTLKSIKLAIYGWRNGAKCPNFEFV